MKIIANSMKKKAEKELTKLREKASNIFELINLLERIEKILKEKDA